MISLQEKKLLHDILNTIDSIDLHLEERRNFEEYKANKTKRRAVERELEIIGEAVSNLLKINPDISISYARLTVDLRNKIIHAYDNINGIIIWKVVMKDIPVLQKEVESFLSKN